MNITYRDLYVPIHKRTGIILTELSDRIFLRLQEGIRAGIRK